MTRWMPLVALLAAGCSETVVTSCQSMCRELVNNCQYAAYPTFDSCMQGCGFNEEQGADVSGQETCIADAQCDTFAIVECEHAYNE